MKFESLPVACVTTLEEDRTRIYVPIRTSPFTIGKGPDNDLCFPEDDAISRNHCAIEVNNGGISLRDLDSRNGTYVGGERVEGVKRIAMNSWFSLGRTRLALVLPKSDFDRTQLVQSAYSTAWSIILPDTTQFQERTESFLIVDVMGSTRIIEQYGESTFAKLVVPLGQILERTQRREKAPYLQCTGDGFFACYETAGSALAAVHDILKRLDLNLPFEANLSVALHWGTARFRAQGILIGKHVHAAFALENLHKKLHLTSFRSDSVSNLRLLALMTEPFVNRLGPTEQAKVEFLGEYELGGLEGKWPVYQWCETRSGDGNSMDLCSET